MKKEEKVYFLEEFEWLWYIIFEFVVELNVDGVSFVVMLLLVVGYVD